MDKIKRYFKPDQLAPIQDRPKLDDLKIDDVDEDGELIEGDNKRIGMIGLESGDDLNNALKHVGKIVKKTIPAKSEPKVPEAKISSSNEESEKKNTDIVKSEQIAKKNTSTILSTFNLTKKKEQKIERVNNSNIDNIEQQNQKFSIRPVNIEMAKKLRYLIFGNTSHKFPQDWLKKELRFSDLFDEKYVLIQFESESSLSGLLSSLQAYIILEMLSNYDKPIKDVNLLFNPTGKERSIILAKALTKMLLKCANGETPSLAIPSSNGYSNKNDEALETYDIVEFDKPDYLETYLIENIDLFEANKTSSHCILILVSVILSRGIDRIMKDMDKPSKTLLTENNGCSNELLNLLIHGRAVSNFSNDSPGETRRGPKQRNEIGFLSSVDKAGSFYMTPKYPIWLVRLENVHFGLVFSLKKDILNDWKAECIFNLYFIESSPSQKQQESVVRRLTLFSKQFNEIKVMSLEQEEDDDKPTPIIETVLQTKWKESTIEWN